MFFIARVLRPLTVFLLCFAVFAASHMYSGWSAAQENYATETEARGENREGTIVYDRDYFARFPNAVSAADILERIPGGQQALDSGGGNARGFSRNEDNILINGKRLSGKSNDSRGVLERINLEQVQRIEVIRGSSPDIKVSSQEAIFNVVTLEGASGSGSWETSLLLNADGSLNPGGEISYNGTAGNLDYFISFEGEPRNRVPRQVERIFDEDGIFVEQLNEDITRDGKNLIFTANLGYTFDSGDSIRLNGQYHRDNRRMAQDGNLFVPDGMGGLVFDGRSFRLEEELDPGFEIGGDISKSLGDSFQLSLLGLFSRENDSFSQAEDFDITGMEVENDILSIENQVETETIGRVSLTWSAPQDHSFEFGTEFANNKLDSRLQFFERMGGMLVEQDISGASTEVKEFRNESFAIHTWHINETTSLETALFTEFSRISQTGDLNNARTFFFFRPSTDLRINLTERDQFQFSFRRRIGQLDFEEFATSVSADDEIVGGNPNLVPWKRWEVELGFEHRLADDKGFVKIQVFHREIQDAQERVEISPGISGVGNVGDARDSGITVSGSYRFADIGLPNLVLEADFTARRARLTDPFTGERRRPDWAEKLDLGIDIRHDVRPLNFSYGLGYNRNPEETFHDLNELIVFRGPENWLELFAEKQIFGGLIFRVTFVNLANVNSGRQRFLFDPDRRTGEIVETEIRDFRWRRRIRFDLRGTF